MKKREEKILCNRCGRVLKQENGIVREGIFEADIRWSFFSEKDGQRHQFCLCEHCYDEMIKGFAVPVTVRDMTEYL